MKKLTCLSKWKYAIAAEKSSVSDWKVGSALKLNALPIATTAGHAGLGIWVGKFAPLQLNTTVCVPVRSVPVTRFGIVTFAGLAQRAWPVPDNGHSESGVSAGESRYTFPGSARE